MKKLLLTGIAALFLATGTAHAQLNSFPRGDWRGSCGSSWQICAEKARGRAIWQAQHPGGSYRALLIRCFRATDHSSTFAMQRCRDQVNGKK